VRALPGPGAPVRVSSDGGHDPVWSRDGKELFYQNGPKLLSARVVSEAPDFRVDAPSVVFEQALSTTTPIRTFATLIPRPKADC